jgi:hypothetical protein
MERRTMTAAKDRPPGPCATDRAPRALRHAAALALALAAAGCAELEGATRTDGTDARQGTAARFQRELDMNRRWQNRPLSDLVATSGKPQLTMNIPGGGNPPGFVVVYGLDDRSGCIDAFAINAAVTREPTVRIYYCR